MTSILCCGCFRIMGTDGLALGEKASCPVDPAALVALLKTGPEGCAAFATKQEADSAAQQFGWYAVEGNHRCPECYANFTAPERHGAYIEWGQV